MRKVICICGLIFCIVSGCSKAESREYLTTGGANEQMFVDLNNERKARVLGCANVEMEHLTTGGGMIISAKGNVGLHDPNPNAKLYVGKRFWKQDQK